ncbi:MAG: S9 family peptidase [Gammaproteobacteria bacterium]|nr:S9 family peptidase [Gammaproteobacteria bacterium]
MKLILHVSRLLAVLLPLLLSGALAQAEGLTLEHIARLQAVTGGVISPDGQRIAYSVAVPRKLFDEPDGEAWSELHIVDARGAHRGYVTGQVNVSALGWTPDSRHVTFLAKRGEDEHAALYRIAVDGGEAVRWFGFDTAIRGYGLAPDGRTLAFIAQDAEDEDTKSLKDKGFNQRIYEEDWRAFRVRLVDLDADDREVRTLELDGSAQQLAWSPDGSRLAVKLAPRELIDDVLMKVRISFVDPAAGAITATVDTPGKLGDMAWAPDSGHLALIMAEDANDPREGRLAVVAKDGDNPVNLLPDLEGHVWQVAWRDARRVLYISHEGVRSRLGEIRRDGSADRTVLDAGDAVWDGISVSADGRTIALLASSPAHPREVFRLAGNARSAERLTDHNPWLADVRLAAQEVVRYTARDGLEIEGVLIRPLDEQPGTRYPLILQVHGGPEAHYSNHWLSFYSQPGQAAAARGYAVFYPNYRASTGRGVAFTKLNHGRPAAEEFDDLVDGVDHLIEIGLVDGDRVGITGGSYGGYASAWGATYYSERFAASVMFVGISDKISMLGTSDIPVELYQVHYLSWPWEDWSMYRDASPIYYADRSRTPTLILHGDADPRVHVSQSMILYRYLKLAGQAPVRLVLYPGEGHGNARAASRWDYSLRLMRWMDHYLQGEGGEPPDHPVDYR